MVKPVSVVAFLYMATAGEVETVGLIVALPWPFIVRPPVFDIFTFSEQVPLTLRVSPEAAASMAL